MPDLNRSGLLLALVTVLTVAVAYQAYELNSIRGDLREATTVLRAMSGGQGLPLARVTPEPKKAVEGGQATVHGDAVPPGGRPPKSERVKSTVRAGQLHPTVDKTYTPKAPAVMDGKTPCRSGCSAVMECALRNNRCPGVNTKNESTLLPKCLEVCRADASLRAKLTGKTPCDEGLAALRGQVAALDAACVHGK